MYKVVTKRFLNEAKTICLFEIEAPLVAKHAQAGQFVIFRLDEQGERVPVSVAGWDREKGTVTVMVRLKAWRRYVSLAAAWAAPSPTPSPR